MIGLLIAFTLGTVFGCIIIGLAAAASRQSELERLHHYNANKVMHRD